MVNGTAECCQPPKVLLQRMWVTGFLLRRISWSHVGDTAHRPHTPECGSDGLSLWPRISQAGWPAKTSGLLFYLPPPNIFILTHQMPTKPIRKLSSELTTCHASLVGARAVLSEGSVFLLTGWSLSWWGGVTTEANRKAVSNFCHWGYFGVPDRKGGEAHGCV